LILNDKLEGRAFRPFDWFPRSLAK
jgi:hypothetical protein